VLVYLLRPLAFALLLWRGMRNRRYWEALSERLGFGARCAEAGIWVHAVSLGEVTAAAAIIRALHVRHPRQRVTLTTATPTGRARARALFGAALDVRYLPYDTPGSMRRFIGRIKPRVAIIMETELWPNLFHQCRRRGIPVVLASARLAARSVARYLRFGRLFRDVFRGNTLIAAQSALDAGRFIAIGADPLCTRVIGNVKFDLQPDPVMVARGRALKAAWGGRPVWIAGSTHAGEEEQVLAAHAELEAAAPGALLLLVPRHPERFQSVADLLTRRGFRHERRSSRMGLGSAELLPSDARVLLVDTVGELAASYAAADVAFVGGSLVPVGGHNLLEPAALALPVITGPYQANGREIAELLLREGGALQVANERELAAVLRQLVGDPARRAAVGANARRVVDGNRGSTLRLLELIEPFLPAAC
jgi:3-deoxy-D-manno-octulosonic-acid transferase